jgi:hypothetical protein
VSSKDEVHIVQSMAHIVVWHFVHIVQTPSKFPYLLCALLLRSAEISVADIRESH